MRYFNVQFSASNRKKERSTMKGVIYADAMGFLIPQKSHLEHSLTAAIDPDIALHVCHTTMSPPFTEWMGEGYAHFHQVLAEVRWFRSFLAAQQHAQLVETRGDLLHPLHPDKIRVIGGLQYPPRFLSGDRVQMLRDAGVFFMTLAYHRESDYGGGFALDADEDIGLTEKGRQLLRWMAEAGMVLDLSHASARTAREALDFIIRTGLPLAVSATHTGCFEAYDHPRNLPKEILRRIREMDGFVGLYTLTFGLDPDDNSLRPFFRHLVHLRAELGDDYLGIGSDGIYLRQSQEATLANDEVLKQKLDPTGDFRSRSPDQPVILNTPRRMEVMFQEINHAFNQHTLNPEDWPEFVRKLTGENFFNFLQRAMR